MEFGDYPFGWVKPPKMEGFTQERIALLPKAKRERAQQLYDQYMHTISQNPLYGVYARSQNQHDFMASKAFISAVFAGNRFGKTAAQVILALVNCIPLRDVPPHLIQYRTYLDEQPFYARMCVPKLDTHAIGVTVPLLRRWVPPYTLEGGKWDSGWSKRFSTLSFANGSFIEFRSYDQDISAHQGTSRHGIFFDEQPSLPIYEENRARTAEYEGAKLWFALTPLGISWVYYDLYKRRNEIEEYKPGVEGSDDIECFSGSIHDNDTLSKENVQLALGGIKNKNQRRAREFGEFVAMQGRIYDDFIGMPADDEIMPGHIVPRISPVQLQMEEGRIYVGIDPGLRHPAASFMVANSLKEQVLIFDEYMPEMSTMNVRTFAEGIRAKLETWGIDARKVTYIIDPAAKIRDINTGETTVSEFARHGIMAAPGNNDLDVGISRVTDLIAEKRLALCENCPQTKDEFEIWSWADREDMNTGKKKPEEGNDHLLDCIRYVVMALGWEGSKSSVAAMHPNAPTLPAGTVGGDIQRHQIAVPDDYAYTWQ